MSSLETDGLVAALVVIVLAALVVVWVWWRQRHLVRDRNAFICALRTLGEDRVGSWTIGCGRYANGMFEWYRSFGLGLRPRMRLDREGLRLVEHHRPGPEDRLGFLVDHEVVTVDTGLPGRASRCQLALSPQMLTGLMSWSEASPPGGVGYAARQRL